MAKDSKGLAKFVIQYVKEKVICKSKSKSNLKYSVSKKK